MPSQDPQGSTTEAGSPSLSPDHNALFWHQFGHHHQAENDHGMETQEYENHNIKEMESEGKETATPNPSMFTGAVEKGANGLYVSSSQSNTTSHVNSDNKVRTVKSLATKTAMEIHDINAGKNLDKPNLHESLSNTLTHVNTSGEARMVDVSGKAVTLRQAVARAEVALGPTAFHLVKQNKAKKGDVLGVARVAGIMAAKRTSDLIPLCHPLPLNSIEINLTLREYEEEEGQGEPADGRSDVPDEREPYRKHEAPREVHLVVIEAKAVTSGRTGVEMEALVAASVAALTVYDMCKAVSHAITISNVRLIAKSGGKRDYSAV